jgi:hypothetical protein
MVCLDVNSDLETHHFVSVFRDDEPTRDTDTGAKLIPELFAL